MFYLGYFFMIWWSAAAGLIIGALSERTEWAEKIWQPYSYLYLFFSGFFVLAAWLPESIRGWALLQPSLQAYEMIRGGCSATRSRHMATQPIPAWFSQFDIYRVAADA